MVGRIIEADRLHAADFLEIVQHAFRVGIGDICHHDLCRAVGDKLPFHDVQRFLCLGVLRQIERQIILHLDPAAGEHGENDQNDGNQEKQIAFVHDKRRELDHKALAAGRNAVRLFCHAPGSFLWIFLDAARASITQTADPLFPVCKERAAKISILVWNIPRSVSKNK